MVPWLCVFLVASTNSGELRGRIVFKTTERARDFTLSGPRLGNSVFGIDDVDALKLFSGKSWGWLTYDVKSGFTYRIPNVPQGKHLLYVTWQPKRHYMDWRWIYVKEPKPASTIPEIDFTMEPDVCGTVELSLAAGMETGEVSFMPADEQGRVPDWSHPPHGSFVTEKVVDGKAVFRGLRPGKYVFYPALTDRSDPKAPEVRVSAEVKAKETARLVLEQSK